MPLDIVHAGAAEALAGGRKARGRDVAGDDAAAVFHHGRQCQGLAGGAGAQIGHSLAGSGRCKQGDELAAFVLDLHQTLAEGLGGGDVLARGGAQAPRGEGRGLGGDALRRQGGARRLARRLQQVDAQIKRRRLVHRRHRLWQRVAEAGAEAGQAPLRQVEREVFRHLRRDERPPGQGARQRLFGGGKRWGAVAGISEQGAEGGQRQAFHQQGGGEGAQPRRRRSTKARQMPIQPQRVADGVPDGFGNGAPVAAADEAAAAEELGGSSVRRAAGGGRDRLQQSDRGGEAGGGCHPSRR